MFGSGWCSFTLLAFLKESNHLCTNFQQLSQISQIQSYLYYSQNYAFTYFQSLNSINMPHFSLVSAWVIYFLIFICWNIQSSPNHCINSRSLPESFNPHSSLSIYPSNTPNLIWNLFIYQESQNYSAARVNERFYLPYADRKI